jgi:hypothetical protein
MRGKEIIIDDKYSIQWDGSCFNLHRKIKYTNRDGEPDTRKETSFHNSLSSIVKTLLKEKSGQCETLQEILELHQRANAMIEGIYGTIFENLDTGLKRAFAEKVKEFKEKKT